MSDSMEDRFPSQETDEEDLMFEDELGDLEFADNPEPRCPVLVIADCSGSMGGRPIDAMNQGVDDLYRAIVDDEIARNRVEVALLSFSTEARVERDFGTVSNEGRTRIGSPGRNQHASGNPTGLRSAGGAQGTVSPERGSLFQTDYGPLQ